MLASASDALRERRSVLTDLLQSADEDRDALDRVVAIAADVPARARAVGSRRSRRSRGSRDRARRARRASVRPSSPRERIAGLVEHGVPPGAAAVVAHLDPLDRAERRTRRDPGARPRRRRRCGLRVRNSGMPGGTIRLRGSDPRDRPRRRPRDRCATGSRARSGSPRTARVRTEILESHFTLVIPYQPGTTRRSGNPCCGSSGCPFISYASRTLVSHRLVHGQRALVGLLHLALDRRGRGPANATSIASVTHARLLEESAERRAGPLGGADRLEQPRLADRPRLVEHPAVARALERDRLRDARPDAEVVEVESSSRSTDPSTQREPPRRGVDLGDVVVDEQVVQAGGREVVAQRLERHPVVARRELELLARDPLSTSASTPGRALPGEELRDRVLVDGGGLRERRARATPSSTMRGPPVSPSRANGHLERAGEVLELAWPVRARRRRPPGRRTRRTARRAGQVAGERDGEPGRAGDRGLGERDREAAVAAVVRAERSRSALAASTSSRWSAALAFEVERRGAPRDDSRGPPRRTPTRRARRRSRPAGRRPAVAVERGADREPVVLDQPEHPDHRRRPDRRVARLVVEAHVPAGDRRPEGRGTRRPSLGPTRRTATSPRAARGCRSSGSW